MKTKEFLEILENNPSLELVFEYQPNALVGANYHITEVKNITVESVDCGGRQDSWQETIVQLWESPSEKGKTVYMTSYKALQILKRVHGLRPMNLESEIKFEYGNSEFHTSVLHAYDFKINHGKLYVSMSLEETHCKANDICGVPEEVMLEEASDCTPGSGCC